MKRDVLRVITLLILFAFGYIGMLWPSEGPHRAHPPHGVRFMQPFRGQADLLPINYKPNDLYDLPDDTYFHEPIPTAGYATSSADAALHGYLRTLGGGTPQATTVEPTANHHYTTPGTRAMPGADIDPYGHIGIGEETITAAYQQSGTLHLPLLVGDTSAPPQKQVILLHTNDFHGNLQPDSNGRGGSAHMAGVIKGIRQSVGPENVVLMDAGDSYLAAKPISQLLLGQSTIDIYNRLGYQVSAYGNHEFDKGQSVLISRTMQSDFPWISANIIISGTNWEHPAWSQPYITLTLGLPADRVVLGVLGLTTDETPLITLKGATEGLDFKDPTTAVLRYYDEVSSQSDAFIVLAHIGTNDGGRYKGLRTIAQELIDAGKTVDIIIGGHRHEPLFRPVMVGDTAIIQAGYHGRWLGKATLIIDPGAKRARIDRYSLITINQTVSADQEIAARVAYWADMVAPIIQQPVGTTNISLLRNYNAESNLGNLVTDGMRWKADLNDDGELNGSVDIALTNPGGLRENILIPVDVTPPYTITWSQTFSVLPFGNTLFTLDLTGAQILTLLNQSASLFKGILQTSGASYRWYNDCRCAKPTSWGATSILVRGEPLLLDRVYRVVTNDFLADGQDGWTTFAAGTNRQNVYVDMQEGVNEYIAWYNREYGPLDHTVEGRIVYDVSSPPARR